jgi:tRNA threonylcarbamoyladenosine biosynthesis protein TsaE
MKQSPSNLSDFVFVARDEQDTDRLGRLLAAACEPNLVIGLVGSLGAGKTRLVRATAIALGAAAHSVNSPTFVLIQEYSGRIPVFHFDTYRLPNPRAFADLGAEEYFSAGGVCLVEWADRVRDHLPVDHLRIEVEVSGSTSRLFRVSANGPSSNRVLARLQSIAVAASGERRRDDQCRG